MVAGAVVVALVAAAVGMRSIRRSRRHEPSGHESCANRFSAASEATRATTAEAQIISRTRATKLARAVEDLRVELEEPRALFDALLGEADVVAQLIDDMLAQVGATDE